MRARGYLSAVVLSALTCASCGGTSPSSPSVASGDAVSLDAIGTAQTSGRGGGGGGNGGSSLPVLYQVVIDRVDGTMAPIVLDEVLELTSDTKRVVSYNMDNVNVDWYFSDATVNEDNCHWTEGYIWESNEIQALRDQLTDFSGQAEGIDFWFTRRTGLGGIRRRGPWARWCLEEDGTSGGCAGTETIDPNTGVRTYVMSGTNTSPQRWLRTIDGGTGTELVCKDQDTGPDPNSALRVTATPLP